MRKIGRCHRAKQGKGRILHPISIQFNRKSSNFFCSSCQWGKMVLAAVRRKPKRESPFETSSEDGATDRRRPVLTMSPNLSDSIYLIGKAFSTWNNKIHNDYQDKGGHDRENTIPRNVHEFSKLALYYVLDKYRCTLYTVHAARECCTVTYKFLSRWLQE